MESMTTGLGLPALHRAGISLGFMIGMLTAATWAQHPSRPTPVGTRVSSSTVEPKAVSWHSPSMIHVADLDSTTAPCDDFYQYANGRWYQRRPSPSPIAILGDHYHNRIAQVLQQFVERAPALALTTTDVVTRALGTFYGSCLTDATGAAEGAVGDTTRARYCFKTTRRYLDPALFAVLLTQVWPPAARAESRRLWEDMKVAAAARIRASAVLRDSTKQEALTRIAATNLYVHGGMESQSHRLPFLPLLDSLASPRVYTGMALSPTDFARNLARVRAGTDTLSPFRRTIIAPLLDDLFSWSKGTSQGIQGSNDQVTTTPNSLMPPVVAGTLDVGGWYGTVVGVLGHELTHNFERGIMGQESFVKEQLRGQLEVERPDQLFTDHIGILIAYDAFRLALRRRPEPRLEGLTPEHRFFLGVAQAWRGGEVLQDVWRWRIAINGAMSAMPAFAAAFGCKPGDAMAGERIWYQDPRPPQSVPRRPGEPTEREWQYAVDWAPSRAFWLNLLQIQGLMVGPLPGHEAEQQALTDSLGLTPPGGIPAAHRQRKVRLMTRQLGEVRSRLTPAQQVVFDARVHLWLRQHTELSRE